MIARALIGAELKAFVRYLARPRRTLHAPTMGTPLQRWLIALAGLLAVDAVVVAPIGAMAHWLGMTHLGDDRTPAADIVLGILLVPAFEECLFRAGLRSATYSLFVAPAVIALLLGGRPVLPIVLAVGGTSLLVSTVLRRRLPRRPGAATTLGRAYVHGFPLVFYGYAAMFAIAHLGNWQSSSPAAWLSAPLLVVPQLCLGIVAGYLRIRDSLGSAIALHMAVNATATAVDAVFN